MRCSARSRASTATVPGAGSSIRSTGRSTSSRGHRHWGTQIALEVDGAVALGVVTRPMLHAVWWATLGGGAFKSERGGRARSGSRCRVGPTWPRPQVRLWNDDLDDVAWVRAVTTWTDADMNDILDVAEGRCDAVLSAPGEIWDHAPNQLLVEEAGGRFRDARGGRRLDGVPGALHERRRRRRARRLLRLTVTPTANSADRIVRIGVWSGSLGPRSANTAALTVAGAALAGRGGRRGRDRGPRGHPAVPQRPRRRPARRGRVAARGRRVGRRAAPRRAGVRGRRRRRGEERARLAGRARARSTTGSSACSARARPAASFAVEQLVRTISWHGGLVVATLEDRRAPHQAGRRRALLRPGDRRARSAPWAEAVADAVSEPPAARRVRVRPILAPLGIDVARFGELDVTGAGRRRRRPRPRRCRTPHVRSPAWRRCRRSRTDARRRRRWATRSGRHRRVIRSRPSPSWCPSNLAGLSARRTLAERSGLANVAFDTPFGLAERLGPGRGGRRGLPRRSPSRCSSPRSASSWPRHRASSGRWPSTRRPSRALARRYAELSRARPETLRPASGAGARARARALVELFDRRAGPARAIARRGRARHVTRCAVIDGGGPLLAPARHRRRPPAAAAPSRTARPRRRHHDRLPGGVDRGRHRRRHRRPCGARDACRRGGSRCGRSRRVTRHGAPR